jgi:hypothetical protein
MLTGLACGAMPARQIYSSRQILELSLLNNSDFGLQRFLAFLSPTLGYKSEVPLNNNLNNTGWTINDVVFYAC